MADFVYFLKKTKIKGSDTIENKEKKHGTTASITKNQERRSADSSHD